MQRRLRPPFLSMQVVSSKQEIRNVLDRLRLQGKSIGFVPTMGALHKGHMTLVEQSKANADITVVSIFVNPTQFGPKEDLERYPKPLKEDMRVCEAYGVDILFTPEASEMYPDRQNIGFVIETMTDHLCGQTRPGHFQGVVQIVNKLFNIVEPDVAVFGLKDIQQFRIIERMVEEFDHPIRILPGETVRENDGLAVSSRNLYLTEAERKKAPSLYQAIYHIAKEIEGGNTDLVSMLDEGKALLERSECKIDYLSVVDYQDLQPLPSVQEAEKIIVAGAVFLGKSRLIDNLIVNRNS